MALKIGIVNQKGGVGKTTTALCLTDAFTQMGLRTLLVDFDPQGNSSSVFDADKAEKTIKDCILNKVPIKDVIIKDNDMGDIVPSNESFGEVADILYATKAAEFKLKVALEDIEDDYDVIVVDSGPTAGKMMDNVLTAVNGIIVPMEAETFSIKGLTLIINNVTAIRDYLNPDLKIFGILLTKYKGGSTQKDARKSFDELPETLHAFKTIIRDSDAIPSVQGFKDYEGSTSYHEQKKYNSKGSIYKYDSNNNAAIDYSNFAKELMSMLGVIEYGE